MKKQSLKDKAYHTIKEKIVNCEYPPNSFLNETALMDEIGASRTPIREALSKLEQENLVTILPKKGVVVSDLTINEISMIFETRILLEPYILKNYGQLVPGDLLAKMRDSFDLEKLSGVPMNEIYQKDDQFHQLLTNASNNRYFVQTMEHTYNQNFRLRVLSGNKIEARIRNSNSEHLEIIDCMLKSDYTAAAEAMRVHLEKAREACFSSLFSNGIPSFTY